MLNMPYQLILFMLSLFAVSSAIASDSEFLHDKYRGWFFREPEPVPAVIKKPKQDEVKTQQPKEAALKPLTQDWFEKNLPKLRDQAIDNPTKENVVAFLTVQKLWADAATNFASSFSNVVMENPWLTSDKFRPTANFGSQFYDRRAKQNKELLIEKISEKTGLWFFFASYCESCHVIAPVLRDMRERLGVPVLAVSIDGKGIPDFPKFTIDRGQARKYNVTSTPTIMAYRDNKLYPIGEGIISTDQIIDRMLYFAKEYGWITEQEWNKAQVVDFNAVLPPGFMNTVTDHEANNPKLLADKVKRQLIQQNQQ